MGCDNQTRAWPNSIIQTADVQCSIRPARHHGYVNTGCFKVTQRPHDGVVLHARRYDVITGPDHAVNSEIECVRSVVRKNDPAWIFCVEHLGERLSRVLDKPGSGNRHLVPGAAGIPSGIGKVFIERGAHSWRFRP